MPYKTVEEIIEIVEKDKKIAESNDKVSKYLIPWVNGRNYFDGVEYPLFPKYKERIKGYNEILFNKEEGFNG